MARGTSTQPTYEGRDCANSRVETNARTIRPDHVMRTRCVRGPVWFGPNLAPAPLVPCSAARNIIVGKITTDGPHGFIDVSRGTASERVLPQAHGSVADPPVGSNTGLKRLLPQLL